LQIDAFVSLFEPGEVALLLHVLTPPPAEILRFMRLRRIYPPPENPIDIALRGMAIPGKSLIRPPEDGWD
jgi:hypothetical protein